MAMSRTVLQLAVTAGETLLKNGAEIYRVQETIDRILRAFLVEDFSIYIVSNGIFVSVGEGGENQSFAMRSVPVSSFHLGRIVEVNELSRAIVQNPDEAMVSVYQQRLEACGRLPHFPFWLRALCCGVGSACFCFLFGSRVAECLAAFVCGVILQAFMTVYHKSSHYRFMDTLLGAALVSSLAVGMCEAVGWLSLDSIIIGAIISLVPGVALTTAIRDFFNGDFLSGIIHLIDALLTGVCIAVGVGVALSFWQFVAGGGLW